MKKMCSTVILLVLTAAFLAAQTPVKISMTASDKAKYQHFLTGKNILDKLDYHAKDLDSSSVLDVVLIQKALTLGGLNFRFDVVEIPNTERERAMLLEGIIQVAGNSQWDFFCEENKDKIYASDVVIPSGSFEKGLYALKERLPSLKVQTAADLAKISCISSSNWRVDWKTLKALGFKNLYDAPTRDTMFKMVEGGRADVTAQSFAAGADMSITNGSVTLYPIPGVKIVLDGNRHYVVSKASADSKKIYDALQKGLALMKKDNEIRRALVESGFYNADVKNWKIIKNE